METNPNYEHFGLNNEQIVENREKYGKNVLTPPPKEPVWKLFLKKFTDPIIVILLVALLLSIGIAIYEKIGLNESFKVFLEPTGIFIALMLATIVGFIFELNANKKFEALNQVNDETLVKVKRNGNICQVPKKDVVVGDIVIIEVGEEIPADGKLIEAVSLQINESTLTGEPIINKTTNPESFKADATYPSNMVMKGTTVADGHGIMLVSSVGDSTEYGKVYKGSQIESDVETPLNIQLKRLSHLISIGSYIIASLILAVRIIGYFHSLENFEWLDFGTYLLKTVMIAVTLIVVSVPEGLPMSVTLSLALSMKRMLATNNLVRKMHACETMGATTVICTDKTGTLTKNQMQVACVNFTGIDETLNKNNEILNIIIEGIAVNSTAYLDFSDNKKINVLGNPTEGALLLWLYEQGVNYLDIREKTQLIEQLTFSTERKYMATIAVSGFSHKKILYVKGAPEIILNLCKNVGIDKEEITQKLTDYQNQAMRTLGFAYQIIENDNNYIKDGKLNNVELTFLGIAAISDPIRSDVADAVKDCLNAGINVKIVTGDTPNTAKEIGRQIGLWAENEDNRHHLTGIEFNAMSDQELLEVVIDLKILSRARPMDKHRLVSLLQTKNQVVAVTGDGTNDAPALKVAQVGLSMGDGTSVAKEASDITILDNSFASISRAVMWGRSLYQNIQRFILFQLTINLIACVIVLLGAFVGIESPLTVTQMLWVNLIMDTFAAMALASLPPEKEVMNNKPRKYSEHIITKKMALNIVSVGLSMLLFLVCLLQYFRFENIESLTQFDFRKILTHLFDFSDSGDLTAKELTIFFTFFVMLQFWNIFNAKAFLTGRSAFSSLKQSKFFIIIAIVILSGQILIVNIGGTMFNVTKISLSDWLIIIGSTSLVLLFGEIIRLVKSVTKK